MRVRLQPVFGELPETLDNLVIHGGFADRYEKLNWATVFPLSGLVCSRERWPVIESIWVKENLGKCYDYHSLWSRIPKYLRGEYFNLSLFWWDNYYHWHCDILPRFLKVVEEYKHPLKVILPRNLRNWQKQSLECIAPRETEYLTYSGRRPLKLERLHWQPPLAMTGDQHDVVLKVRDLVMSRLNGSESSASWNGRLFLARKNTNGRRITNEEDVYQILREHGFEYVDCSQISYDNQIALFSKAKWIVAPHGAALTNVLWAPTAANVFEIFEPSSVRRCYWTLCKFLKHNYSCAVGRKVEQTNREPDMFVDIARFKTAIHNWICTS